MSLVCAEANSAESFATVSVSVATVARSAYVAVARFAKESERLPEKEVKSGCPNMAGASKVGAALTRGKWAPAVGRRDFLQERCAFEK